MKPLNGLALAAATAVLLTGCNSMMQKADSAGMKVKAAASDAAMGHCVGANSCKGTSACKTANSECKGLNACAGQGFTVTNAEDCASAGGTFEG